MFRYYIKNKISLNRVIRIMVDLGLYWKLEQESECAEWDIADFQLTRAVISERNYILVDTEPLDNYVRLHNMDIDVNGILYQLLSQCEGGE